MELLCSLLMSTTMNLFTPVHAAPPEPTCRIVGSPCIVDSQCCTNRCRGNLCSRF